MEQQWFFIPTADGYFNIENVKTGNVLDIYEGSRAAGAKLIQYPPSKSENQKFSVIGTGASFIQARHSGQVLDVCGGGITDGTMVVQYPNYGTDNQLWEFYKA